MMNGGAVPLRAHLVSSYYAMMEQHQLLRLLLLCLPLPQGAELCNPRRIRPGFWADFPSGDPSEAANLLLWKFNASEIPRDWIRTDMEPVTERGTARSQIHYTAKMELLYTLYIEEGLCPAVLTGFENVSSIYKQRNDV